MEKYLLLMALFILPEVPLSTLEAIDDFEVPVEITFSRRTLDPVQMRSKKVIHTEGRTRAYRNMPVDSLDDHTLNVTKYGGEMVDNYCCFWVYQTHPAIPQTWKHMSQYPFDFNFNGLFVANKRNNESEVPASKLDIFALDLKVRAVGPKKIIEAVG